MSCPDGKQILFGRQVDGKMDLWIMKADGTDEKQITFTDDWQEGGAFIMADNETIILRAWKKEDEGKRSKDMHIFTVKTDGSDLKQITHESGTHWAPYPSPDGKYFAYVKILPPHNCIHYSVYPLYKYSCLLPENHLALILLVS